MTIIKIFSLLLLGFMTPILSNESQIDLSKVLLDNEFLPEHVLADHSQLQKMTKLSSDISHETHDKPAVQVMGTEVLQNPHEFDIDKYLNDFDALDCDINDPQQIGEGKYEIMCAHKLEEESFKPLSQYETDHESFFNYLNSSVYMPLAYNIPKPHSLSESLLDLVSLGSHSTLVDDSPIKVDYNNFEYSILNLFHTIQNDSSKAEENPQIVTDIMINILKKFHLYWNHLRSNNQVDKAKNDTKEIMRNLLNVYQVKEKFMFEITKAFVQHIKTAYIKFIKAHQFVKLINHHASSIVSHIIIYRYEKLLVQFEENKATDYSLIKELVWLLDLQEAFYIVNYKVGVPEAKSIVQYHAEVLELMKAKFNTFMLQHEINNPTMISEARNFTAIIILKMKHKEYLIFVYHTIIEFANMSKVGLAEYDPLNTKLYYEIIDNMRLIPRRCSNYLVLKSCVFHETNKIVKYLGSKYMLNRSSKGWVVLVYIQHLMKDIFKNATDDKFSDWQNFKTYFYRQLFDVMYNFKKRYQISNDDSIEDLERRIGEKINHFKTKNPHSISGFRIIDQLDKDLYDKFLDLKAEYGKVQDYQTDNIIQGSIEHQLSNFFHNFVQRYDLSDAKELVNLEKQVKEVFVNWTYKTPQEMQSELMNEGSASVSIPEALATMIQQSADNFESSTEVEDYISQIFKNDKTNQPELTDINETEDQSHIIEEAIKTGHEDKHPHEQFTLPHKNISEEIDYVEKGEHEEASYGTPDEHGEEETIDDSSSEHIESSSDEEKHAIEPVVDDNEVKDQTIHIDEVKDTEPHGKNEVEQIVEKTEEPVVQASDTTEEQSSMVKPTNEVSQEIQTAPETTDEISQIMDTEPPVQETVTEPIETLPQTSEVIEITQKHIEELPEETESVTEHSEEVKEPEDTESVTEYTEEVNEPEETESVTENSEEVKEPVETESVTEHTEEVNEPENIESVTEQNKNAVDENKEENTVSTDNINNSEEENSISPVITSNEINDNIETPTIITSNDESANITGLNTDSDGSDSVTEDSGAGEELVTDKTPETEETDAVLTDNTAVNDTAGQNESVIEDGSNPENITAEEKDIDVASAEIAEKLSNENLGTVSDENAVVTENSPDEQIVDDAEKKSNLVSEKDGNGE